MRIEHVDFLVIGAGIAGASAAFHLAPHGRTLLLERERFPGQHSTGRSAAMFIESYGTPQVRALTRAGRAFLEAPPAGFADHALLSPRGALSVGDASQRDSLDAAWAVLRAQSTTARRLDADAARAMVPVLRPERVAGGVFEPDASDIDAHALHQGFLRGAKAAGARLRTDAEVTAIARHGDGWEARLRHTPGVDTGGVDDSPSIRAAIVVNAAGAWCDAMGALAGVRPLGLEPRRRAAFTFAPPPDLDTRRWPMFMDVDEQWYVKPDAGVLLGSPANADPVPPHDVQPEEWDIALGIHRIQEATTLMIRRPIRTWAGLRSFVADGDLVAGFAPDAPGFLWLAAQGGYGIQTAPAMGEVCAALVRGRPLPARLADFGLTAAMLAPERLSADGTPCS